MIKRLWWEKIPVKVRDYAQIFHRFLNFVPNIPIQGIPIQKSRFQSGKNSKCTFLASFIIRISALKFSTFSRASFSDISRSR